MTLTTPEAILRHYVYEPVVWLVANATAGVFVGMFVGAAVHVMDRRLEPLEFVVASVDVGFGAKKAVSEPSVTTDSDVAADTSREAYKSRPAICTLVEYARIIRDEHSARVHCYEAQEEAYAHMLHHMRSDAHETDDAVKALFGLRIGFPYTGGDQEAIDTAKALSYYVPEGCDP